MKENKKIAIIGCGTMGTIIMAVLKNLGFSVLGFNREDDTKQAEACDVVVLAVKPQDFKNVSLKLNKDTLVISIMAGASVQKIRNQLKVNKIVRAMPNMASRIGQGFVGWYATKQVDGSDKKFTNQLFNATGESMEFPSEDAINKVTAITASGSGYVFYMIQAYLDATKALGIKENVARKMVFQTIKGSLAMIDENTDLNLLVKKVTSKGGTTEAALKVFNKKNTPKIWKDALNSAYKRAKEL